MTEDLLGEETEVLWACKPTPNYEVQLGLPACKLQSRGPPLTLPVPAGGGGFGGCVSQSWPSLREIGRAHV